MNTLSIFIEAYHLSKANKSAIAAIQLKRLRQLVNYSRQHSLYFKQLYKDIPANITGSSQLPMTTKPVLMRHFNEWVTDPKLTIEELSMFISKKESIGDKYLNKYYVCTTSGTTGEPALIVHDTNSRKIYFIIGFIRNLLHRLSFIDLLTKLKTAAIVATNGHFLGYATLVNRVKKSGFMQKFQKIFSILIPVQELVKDLNRFKPDVLAGYPSVIYLLAKEQLQKKLNICPYVITASGETLRPYMRTTIEEAFGCQVINNYGASEVPGLTSECKYKKLHLNSDWYILEVIDERNVLVTNLSNFVQPIIRYKMNDYVKIDHRPCKCGSHHPVISVVGRDDEVLKFISSSGESREILPMAIATIAEESEGVYQSQIVQRSAQQVELKIKALDGKDEKLVRNDAKQRMEEFLNTQGLSNVVVEISDEYPQSDPKSGKFRSVIAAA